MQEGAHLSIETLCRVDAQRTIQTLLADGLTYDCSRTTLNGSEPYLLGIRATMKLRLVLQQLSDSLAGNDGQGFCNISGGLGQ
jgi:hypothetical protein